MNIANLYELSQSTPYAKKNNLSTKNQYGYGLEKFIEVPEVHGSGSEVFTVPS